MRMKTAQEAAQCRAAQTGHVYYVVQRDCELSPERHHDGAEYLVVAHRNLPQVLNHHPGVVPVFCTAD